MHFQPQRCQTHHVPRLSDVTVALTDFVSGNVEPYIKRLPSLLLCQQCLLIQAHTPPSWGTVPDSRGPVSLVDCISFSTRAEHTFLLTLAPRRLQQIQDSCTDPLTPNSSQSLTWQVACDQAEVVSTCSHPPKPPLPPRSVSSLTSASHTQKQPAPQPISPHHADLNLTRPIPAQPHCTGQTSSLTSTLSHTRPCADLQPPGAQRGGQAPLQGAGGVLRGRPGHHRQPAVAGGGGQGQRPRPHAAQAPSGAIAPSPEPAQLSQLAGLRACVRGPGGLILCSQPRTWWHDSPEPRAGAAWSADWLKGGLACIDLGGVNLRPELIWLVSRLEGGCVCSDPVVIFCAPGPELCSVCAELAVPAGPVTGLRAGLEQWRLRLQPTRCDA